MKHGLTKKQAECLGAIQRLTVDGVPPSYEELRADLKVGKSRVHRLLSDLRRRGHIDWRDGCSRSLYVLSSSAPTIADLHDMPPEQLRALIAHATGILAAKTSNVAAGDALHRVWSRITHQPRVQ